MIIKGLLKRQEIMDRDMENKVLECTEAGLVVSRAVARNKSLTKR